MPLSLDWSMFSLSHKVKQDEIGRVIYYGDRSLSLAEEKLLSDKARNIDSSLCSERL